ncbi:MAG: ABC transporter ATP-binding protein [Anaerolineae bacterium]|nr:ABC transporter ATP-binding protein [Anaerolineae bacterium]
MSIALQTHDLSIGYPVPRRAPVALLSGYDVTLRAGELVCLIGPNGAGKSTLLRTLAGLQAPLAGHVCIDGQDVTQMDARARAQRIGIVLTERQSPGLLTGYGLVALGRHPYTDWMGRLSARDEAVVQWAVDAVAAADYAARPLEEMSDGQRQKLLIARALAQEPAVLLLDEPTAYLDLACRIEIMRLLRDLARTTGRAILLSTHDLELALHMADRIWLLADGVLHTGAPEDLALDGAFEAAFQTVGVTLNPATGSFVLQNDLRQPIHLGGDGAARAWTERALERAGFEVSANGAPLRIEIDQTTSGHRWQLWQDGACQEYPTLYALIDALKVVTQSSE